MLQTTAWISLSVAIVCSIIIGIDEIRHPQKMWIMNIVWPATALYFSVFAVSGYFRYGRPMSADSMRQESKPGPQQRGGPSRKQPRWSQVALADSHCGAGCGLADIVAEFAVFALALTLFGSELWASYAVDYAAAWSLGVAFQYFTIVPMRNLAIGEGLWAAIKADTLSITAFQIGMYGWMAFVFFVLFPRPHLHPNQPLYWLMMQIAMICGFLTAYPMNALLIRIGWKEVMG